MGILIKDMKMPEERESFMLTIKYNGLVFDTETGIQVAEAQEVPPHGRLIDADALAKDYDSFPVRIDPWVWNELSHAPTIIPAEEVYGQYTDTAGNYHWFGTRSGEHIIKSEEGKT